jgi:hypothetical protein
VGFECKIFRVVLFKMVVLWVNFECQFIGFCVV